MEETNAQRAYQYLRNRLIEGDFTPGTRIRYGPIGEKLGISATPVREAIGQLANEGFVELVPQLGAVVRQVSGLQVKELYELREALEPYAAARAAERIGTPRIDDVQEQLQQMTDLTKLASQSGTEPIARQTIRDFEKSDLVFHMLIIEAAGNEPILRAVENSHVLTKIFSVERHGYDKEVMKATCEDHRRIALALERRKPDAARDAMAVHIRNSLEITMAAHEERLHRWWDARQGE